MSNLYNVSIQIGNRKINARWYANSYNDIITFVNANLVGKIVLIQEIVYEAPASQVIPVDDPLTYKSPIYYQVRNETAKASARVIIPLVKKTKSAIEVFNSLKVYLKLSKTVKIDSMTSASISFK